MFDLTTSVSYFGINDVALIIEFHTFGLGDMLDLGVPLRDRSSV